MLSQGLTLAILGIVLIEAGELRVTVLITWTVRDSRGTGQLATRSRTVQTAKYSRVENISDRQGEGEEDTSDGEDQFLIING